MQKINDLLFDIDKAKKELKWTPLWSNETAISKTIDWYREFYQNGKLNTDIDIEDYSIVLNNIQ